MPRHKDRKRIIRNRMKKTGESHTAARAHVIARPSQSSRQHQNRPRRACRNERRQDRRKNRQDVAGMDARSRRGRRRRNEASRHRGLVHGKHPSETGGLRPSPSGYERIKGLREKRRSGEYEATKSRTFGVPVSTLFEAWADGTARRKWLGSRRGGADRDRTEIDAPAMAGRHDHRRQLHRKRTQ